MKSVAITPQIEAFRSELLKLLDKHFGHLPSEHMLAVTSHMVGQMIAMQDQRRFTAATIMELVSRNIEAGNQNAVEALVNNTAGHA